MILTDVREQTTLVALLEWTYRRQKADLMTGKGLWQPEELASGDEDYHGGWSGDGCAALESFGEMGAIIPSTGHLQRAAVHDDAVLVHEAVVALSATDWVGAMLLRRYGRQGGAPEWRSSQPHPVPVFVGASRNPLTAWFSNEYTSGAGRRRRFSAQYCPVDYTPPPGIVEIARGEYRMWWAGLNRLNSMIASAGFRRWRLDGAGAESEPWSQTTA
jgi:hypothetical protein